MDHIEIPLLNWIDIKEIIASNHLECLGRSYEQQIVYFAFREKIALEWNSMRDYILATKFHFEISTGINGKHFALNGESISIRKSVVLNDFPYHFQEGVIHLIYWKLGESLSLNDLHLEATKYVVSHPDMNIMDYTVFLNPEHLKSIPDIEHGHILVLAKLE